MSLTLDELGLLNSWISSKIRWNIAEREVEQGKRSPTDYERKHLGIEMQTTWMQLCDLATDNPKNGDNQ